MAFPSTHWSLLEGLHGDADKASRWARFQALYQEPIHTWFLSRRVQPVDADDLTQSIVLRLYENLHRYDPQQGPFRPWLRTLLGNMLMDYYRDRQRHPGNFAVGGSTAHDVLAQLGANDSLDGLCSRVDECRDPLLAAAIQAVQAKAKPQTWQAFEALVLHGRMAKDVAAEVGLSIGAIHQARYRLLAMLGEEYARLQGKQE